MTDRVAIGPIEAIRGAVVAPLRRNCWFLFLSAFLGVTANLLADEANSTRQLQAAFQAVDQSRNGTLSREEFLAQKGNQKVLERDFALFDFDKDGELTYDEFAAIPGAVPVWDRGSIPDPFDDLLDQAVAAMDVTYANWDRTPNRMIAAPNFARDFMSSLSPLSPQLLTTELIKQADENGDQQTSRTEARRFLEIQLGIRAADGQLLRQPNGRVVSLMRFYYFDINRDGAVDLAEFTERSGAAKPAEEFAKGDRNGNGKINLEEYSQVEWNGYDDFVQLFRNADRNLDGLLNAEEIKASLPAYRQTLAPLVLPTFDVDHDGQLSLFEYQLSIIGNRYCGWEVFPKDLNRDEKMSFEEFKFDHCTCHLLRRLYFYRFDTDGNGHLSNEEYPFILRMPNTLQMIKTDGSERHELLVSREFPSCGSPAVSPDGEWIAFDGYRGGESLANGQVLMIDRQGGRFRALCPGLMPTWSKDGKQLACSRQTNPSSVWIINADGTDHKKIDNGWGAQWSPDGKTISYIRGKLLMAYDVESEKVRTVLTGDQHPYSYLYYNMGWSPDSERLAFKADKPNSYELVSVKMTGDDPDLKVHWSSPTSFDADLTWTPDGKKVLFGWTAPNHKHGMLHELELTPNAVPQVVKGVNPEWTSLSAYFTPDGEWFVVVTVN
ncbi:EF-hand domain-containing protein [Planctomicrobium piriforme]|uniref:EF hand n=1 Tax=Planctomicrobium piriforme TaxID=1576369 RepID=A0A1I3R4R1_9PLAN|nr:EF-hand domain-containing protein [Planctomicrobium piriforme]SFJ41338.1 EF hand [Planctomicrobium piriforme]